ncbi:chaperonin 10 Kd subunit [Aureococcus anophagefferens]|uniref:Chaperonin 10 Kd subunit n=1 Tax=Aureococcus anophagefferens TaxID=44056 RepID=A0ABR1GCF8_AURAN
MRSSTLSAWCAFAALASAFRPGPTSLRPPARRAAEASVNERSFTRQEALYDLVYVERLAPPQTSSGGLILLEPEDPPMHLARVVSVGDGAVGDSGAVTKNAGVAAGDLVYCKFPWGIGPKDEQFGEEGEVRRFSFLRYQDIAAVVKKPGRASRWATAPAPADDSDCEELEATTYTPAELSRRRYEAAVANGEVIEIASDDEAELGVDDATRAAEEAAAAQRDAEQQRVKRRKTADDADRDRRVAQFVVNARALNLGQLAAHCKSAGLKVGGTKQERIARLVYAIEYKVYERPRSDFFTRQIVAAFATKLDAIVSQNAA